MNFGLANKRTLLSCRLLSGCLVLLLAAPMLAQGTAAPAAKAPRHAQAAPPAPATPAAAPVVPAPNDRDVAETQHKLIGLLRLSPTLTTVVARDPSLLADQEYISRNNPQLAAFLALHPEVARNPDFYLFTHLNHQNGSPDEVLVRQVWPDLYRTQPRRDGFDELLSKMPPVLALLVFLTAVAWGTRVFVENRRWTRVFKLQSEVHGKLIEKFGSAQELAAYMDTDAGKRFLEAAPISLDSRAQRMPNAVSRILLPLQVGTVLILLGIGFLMLRNLQFGRYLFQMSILGTLILMPGIGFILSAGLTWLMAARMGLLPGAQSSNADAPNSLAGPWEPTDQMKR